MIAGELPTTPDRAVARLRPGRHLRQPDPGEPGQRRRRRHPVPDGRQLPDERRQQHDRQQRLDPRGRRHRHRRRPERAGRQQHDHEEHDDGDRRDERRPAGAGRPVDRAPTATCCRPRCSALRHRTAPSSATRSCSTTSSGTTGPAPGPAARSPGSGSPATPARSTTGTWGCPTTRSCSRRPIRCSSRRADTTRAVPTSWDPTLRWCPSMTPRSPSSRGEPIPPSCGAILVARTCR